MFCNLVIDYRLKCFIKNALMIESTIKNEYIKWIYDINYINNKMVC